MMTKLEPGERPWSAVKEMMSQKNASSMDSKVSDHLLPMMPLIEEQARKENLQAQAPSPSVDILV